MSSDQFLMSIVAGLVSALTLGIVLWLIRVVWKSRIEPWWENRLYSDARIDGAWETKLITTEEPCDYHEVARATQTGHSLEGTLDCIVGPDKGNVCQFVGVIRNNIVSAYYWNRDKSSIDSGSFALRLEGNGKKLVGHTAYYYDYDHSLVSREYVWSRIEKISDNGAQPAPEGASIA